MNVTEIMAILSGLGSLAAIVISALTLRQRATDSQRTNALAERNSKIEEAAKVVLSYSQLCDDLQAQIAVNNAEIARLRQDLAELRKQSQVDREAWERERAELQEQIKGLQEENRRLRLELVKLQKAGGE